MKNIKKLFIFFIFLFISISSVNAALKCGGGETITEISGASPNGWQAVMPVCVKYIDTGNFDDVVQTNSHVTASQAGSVLEKKYFGSPDGKGYTEGLVPRCGSDKAKVTVDATCTHNMFEDYTPIYGTKEECTTKTVDKNPDCNGAGETACKAGDYCKWTDPRTTEGGVEIKGFCSSEAKTVKSCKEVEDKDNIIDKQCSSGYTYNENYDRCVKRSDDEALEGFGEFGPPASMNSKANSEYHRQAMTQCRKNFGTNAECSCKIIYTFKCPIYKCEAGNKTISTCSPSFQNSNGKATYCVNPSQTFTSTGNTGLYQADPEFNVNSCKNSFATVDCGYANILIEGKYHGLSDNAINLALRLWGVHTARSGFGTVGLSLRQGSTCRESVAYIIKSEMINVYKKTYKWAMNNFFTNSIKAMEYINPKTDVSRFAIACITSDSRLGIACGDNDVYKQAIGLLFNTILGNKEMRNHLRSISGETTNTEPDSVTIKTTGEGYSYINVYTEALDEILEKNQTIICVDENGKVNPGNLPAEQWNQVKDYCTVSARVVDQDGKTIQLVDKDGKAIPSSIAMERCVKSSGCRTKLFSSSVCNITNGGKRDIKVEVNYQKPPSSMVIKKYWSCENPTENQLMYAFDETPAKNSGTTIKTVKDYPIVNYKCSGSCVDYETKTDFKNACSNDLNNYNGVYKSTIKDPSLKCIVNMKNPSNKEMYDYSDYFKVNKNFCRIFCSDEVEFYIADKVKEKSGRTFSYDIEFMVNKTKNKSFKISNVIKSKRTCVSEIYYNTNFTLDTDWKKMYGLSASQAKNIKNWKSLFNAVALKALEEGGRTENLNQLIYDLYNCNMYQDKTIYEKNGIFKPKESALKSYSGDSFDYIVEQFSASNQYGLGAGSKCVVDNSKNLNTCVQMNEVKYDFGGDPDGKSVPMKSYTSTSNTFNNIVYCTGSECFKYDAAKKEEEYDYPTATTKSTANKVIGNKMEAVAIPGNIKFNGRNNVIVPANDYALFQISTEIDYYNSAQYETTPGDGRVYFKGTNTDQKVMSIDKYDYTTSKDAYNSKDCSYLDDKTNRCKITQSFAQVKLYYRSNNSDLFASTLNNANKLKFTCYVDVEAPKPTPLRTNYRNVDPTNLFPYSGKCADNSQLSICPTDENNIWHDQGNTIFEIEQTSEKLKTGELLEYRITLTPTQIKNIRAYNAGNYITERISNCEIKDGAYFNCKSEFLNELRKGKAGSSRDLGTLDFNYSTGESKYTKSKSH